MDRAHAPAQALLLAACAWLPACGLNQAGVAPPDDTIAYPASAVMDRNNDWLLVTNSNADLRYNDGTLMAFSLTRAGWDRDPTDMVHHDPWGPCDLVDDPNPRSDPRHHCCWDRIDGNVLNCDERYYVGSDADALAALDDPNVKPGRGNIRIGSFAAGIVLQTVKCPVDFFQDQSQGEVDCQICNGVSSADDRLLLGVRGDTSLTYIEITSTAPDPSQPGTPPPADTPPVLKCVGDPAAPGDFETCDDLHRIIQAGSALASPKDDPEPTKVPLPDEPYALAIDYEDGLLFVGHLTGNTSRPFSGGYSLFDIAPQIGPGGDVTLPQPRYIAPFPSPFPANSLGSVGITALKAHTDNIFGHVMFASSRYVAQVSGLGTTATCPDNPIREIAAFSDGIVYSSPLLGGETRGIEFLAGQNRAFVLQRSPPALVGFVESSAAPTDVLETCGSPTFLDQHDNGVGPRLFVNCFADGEIYVYDPTVPELVKTFQVGRGPSGLVFDDRRQVAYVVGFGDNNISVVDLTPGSTTEYHVIQRIGFPRTAPR